MLLILDGWGENANREVSAIEAADTPVMTELLETCSHASLITYGEQVGLPQGQMGNSEVGHLNIGAGRIVYQELSRINKAIKENSLGQNTTLIECFERAARDQKTIHFMGLLSDGGVHSHIDHLLALCDLTKDYDLKAVRIHAFLDGRDTAPDGGRDYMKILSEHIADIENVEIASVIGRYYAMDRDKRWERTAKAYDLLTTGKADDEVDDFVEAVAQKYTEGITDEFMSALRSSRHYSPISKNDTVLFFNFRTDRPRQITEVLTQHAVEEQNMKPLSLHYVTMTSYDGSYENVNVIFRKDSLKMTLGEVLALSGKKQLRAAETEKYPHVTYFFSGGKEEAFEGESRVMANSPKVATYDLKPEMSAEALCDGILAEIEKNEADFVCVNFANTDMVGHTGIFHAAVKAAEVVDKQVGRILALAKNKAYATIIIADHGNADIMINPDGSAHTAHTTNPVPVILVGSDRKIKSGILADIAPTILEIMGISQPEEMTGNSLLI